MSKIDIILPAMGEGVVEATIIKILVNPGDNVAEDDVLVEIATDKVDSEITAPEDGVIGEILFSEEDTVKVGQTIMYLKNGNDTENSEPENKVNEEKPSIEEIITEPLEFDRHKTDEEKTSLDVSGVNADDIPFKTENGSFLSPLARSIVKQEEISLAEVNSITGTGINNRITKRDILLYLEKENTTKKEKEITKITPVVEEKQPVISQTDDIEIVKMDRVRQLISKHMTNSIRTSAHVMSAVETDVTNIVNWRNRNKDKFLALHGEKITFTPIFVEAVAKALKDFPLINISIDGENIIKKKNINIGMATALPNGNLIVPVIKNADTQNLPGLAKNVNDLANRARKNNLQPDEIQDGTFTITNFGSFDNIFGTPIINQPEVAILGIGAIKKQVAVIETPTGDTIGIRNKMILSLSYDHRAVDGALGGMFLKRISDYIESFNELDLK